MSAKTHVLTTIKAATVAAGLAVATLAAGIGTAQAHGPGVSFGAPGIQLEFGHRHGPRHFDGGPRFRRDFCRPRKALRKARRRGVRRAYIARVGHRGVIVKGRKWGERVTIGFAHRRGCPVRFVRAR